MKACSALTTMPGKRFVSCASAAHVQNVRCAAVLGNIAFCQRPSVKALQAFQIFAWLFLWMALSWAAMADESTPLFYTRSNIVVIRKTPPQKTIPPLPWQAQGQPTVVQDDPRVLFDVEVRDAMALYSQKGWFNLSSPSEKDGVLLAFSASGTTPIVHSTQYAPLDILLIDHEGTITQIIPNIKLSELDQDIVPSSPVLAFLFLKGGLCEKLSIRPGDTVEYKLFRKPPVVLTVPAPANPSPAPAPISPIP